MRFTSLVVELIRARPRLVVWLVVLAPGRALADPAAAALSQPARRSRHRAGVRPGISGRDRSRPAAGVLARRHRLPRRRQPRVRRLSAGADLRGRDASGRFYQLARAIVGGQQAVLAVLLTMTVVAFSSPGLEFGPLVLARPLWALLLLHSWQLIGQNRRNAWFAWSIEAGLLLLTTSAAIGLLLLVAGFCARHRARPAHADVARSAVCAAGDRRAGAALSDLADPRRCAGDAAMAGDRRSQRARRCTGAGCSAACCWRCPASCCW